MVRKHPLTSQFLCQFRHFFCKNDQKLSTKYPISNRRKLLPESPT